MVASGQDKNSSGEFQETDIIDVMSKLNASRQPGADEFPSHHALWQAGATLMASDL